MMPWPYQATRWCEKFCYRQTVRWTEISQQYRASVCW